MKKIRPVIFAMLLFVMVLSVTACGSDNSNTQSTTGSSQQSSSAAASTTQAGGDTATTGDETSEGVLDGLVDDVEQGMDDAGNGVKDMTDESGGASGNTSDTTNKETTTEAAQ